VFARSVSSFRGALCAAVAIVLTWSLPLNLHAQVTGGSGGVMQPMCVEGCLGDHAIPNVTPTGTAAGQRLQNTGGYKASFTLDNTGGVSGTFTIACDGTGGVTCDGVSPVKVTLAHGQYATLTATYHVGTSDGNIQVTATALPGDAYEDTGWYTVDVVSSPPANAVLVTPQGTELVSRLPNGGPFTDSFTVKNTGTVTQTFTLTRFCWNSVGCIYGGPSSVTLGANAQARVGVSYYTYAETNNGGVGLQATATGATGMGYWQVVIGQPPHAPQIALERWTGGLADRGLCLVLGAGEAAANQCGDLTAAHAMPTVRTIGRDRNLTLVYSSAQATSRLLVPAMITEGMPYGTPDTVVAYLRVNTTGTMVVRDSARYTPWGNAYGIPAAERRQIVLQFSDTVAGTGAYPFQLEVRNIYSWAAGHVYADTASGTLLLVNRSASEFGRGWAVAGVERIYFNQPAGQHGILWTAGDGSTALYDSVGVNTWVAPAAEFRDTITFNGSEYTRHLRHRVQVVYDNLGRHVRTVNRVNQATVFYWNTSSAFQLDSISVPPAGQLYTTYRLSYSGGKLDYIADPVARILNATVTGGNLASIADPDLILTQFGYDGSGRLTSRTSRQGTVNTYAYDQAGRLSEARIRRDSALVDTTRYTAWDGLGFRASSGVSTGALVDTVRTTMDGPRSDVADLTRFSIGMFGAPDTIINALGQRTAIEHGDARFPALATRVTYPTLWSVRQVYNGRGNLTDMVDSTGEAGRPVRHSVWAYADTANPDQPTTVRDGMNRATTFSYNSSGLTQSVQDPRGHVTSFTYTSAPTPLGLVASVTEQQVETWNENAPATDTTAPKLNQTTSFTYDARGNLKTVTAPTGLVSAMVADTIGRVISSYSPVGMRTDRVYDKLNRVTVMNQITAPQAMPYGLSLATMACNAAQVLCADSARAAVPALPFDLTTTYYYGLAGLDSIGDDRGVKQRYRYNAQGDVRETRDEQNAATIAYLNSMGSADSVRLRTGFVIRYQYDALGRLATRVMPSRTYSTQPPGCTSCQVPLTVPGETITYSYDAGGNLIKSDGLEGEVRRSYFRDGALMGQRDTSAWLSDSLTMAYDASGARISLRHFGARTDSIQYVYDGGGTVGQYKLFWPGTTIANRTILVARDALGRRRELTYPGGLAVSYRYDMSGNLRRLWSRRPANGIAVFTLRNVAFDASGHLLRQELVCGVSLPGTPCSSGTSQTTVSGYNHLGWLAWQHPGGAEVDSLGYDASGNVVFKVRKVGTGAPLDTYRFTYGAASNRLAQETLDGGGVSPVQYSYDADGSRWAEWPSPQDNSFRERWYYYDALGRPSGLGRYRPNGLNQEHICRYDSDGQMFMPCELSAPALGFDGASVVTANTNSLWHFVQGDGLDDPLAAVGTAPSLGTQEIFYVTDGAGRVLLAVDSAGNLPTAATGVEGWKGWSYHGAATRTQGFTANRLTNADAPDIAYFRNRLYDQHTGRWTQEDPLGVAGGLNLYQFNGNNPVAYSDPFGLCVPMPWCLLVGAGAGGGTVVLGEATATISVGAAATVAAPVVVAAGLVGWASLPVHPVAARQVSGALVQSDATAVARPLQNTRTGDLPARGEPNTSAAKDDAKGKGQIRDYDGDGKAETDYDFGHDHGTGDPHAHDWDWSKTPPRQPSRPIWPNE